MKPRIKRTIETISAPDGDLIFMRSSADDIRVEKPSPQDCALLSALDGSYGLGDLRKRFGKAKVDGVLAELKGCDLLEDAEEEQTLPDHDRRRFDRQLRYFSDLAVDGGVSAVECQERLSEAKIAILGTGGLGGRIALELAACGIGELRLIDGDQVELSNLNRQIQFTEADIGSPKVRATATRLRCFNRDLTLSTVARHMGGADDIIECVADADLVVDAADWPPHEIEFWVNSACFCVGVPYVAMGHFPPIARVGPLYVPGVTGCFACQDERYRAEFPLYDVAIGQRKARLSQAATLGPACGVIGGLVSNDIIHFLTKIQPPALLGAGYIFDLRTMELEKYKVPRNDGCPVCGDLRKEAKC